VSVAITETPESPRYDAIPNIVFSFIPFFIYLNIELSVETFYDLQVSHVGLSSLLFGRFGETIENFEFSLEKSDPTEKEALSQVVSAIQHKTIENKRFIHPDSQLPEDPPY